MDEESRNFGLTLMLVCYFQLAVIGGTILIYVPAVIFTFLFYVISPFDE